MTVVQRQEIYFVINYLSLLPDTTDLSVVLLCVLYLSLIVL